ncbi:MAG TPA: hypothetical protein PKA58_24395 [Polyangium sp.]|nr:hypothetical protein [Polyangium sp.]
MNDSGYRTPFGPTGENPIDKAMCRQLLDVALRNGGEYADLFFEHRASGGLSFVNGIVRVASRSVTVGMGTSGIQGLLYVGAQDMQAAASYS